MYLGHDSDALGVDGAHMLVKRTNEVNLASFLKSHHGGVGETRIGFKSWAISRTRRWKGYLPIKQLVGFLVTTDLTKSDCTWPVTMLFLDSTGGRLALASCLEVHWPGPPKNNISVPLSNATITLVSYYVIDLGQPKSVAPGPGCSEPDQTSRG